MTTWDKVVTFYVNYQTGKPKGKILGIYVNGKEVSNGITVTVNKLPVKLQVTFKNAGNAKGEIDVEVWIDGVRYGSNSGTFNPNSGTTYTWIINDISPGKHTFYVKVGHS